MDWRRAQLARLPNVSVVTGRRLSAADVLDYGASLVVVASGCSWAADGSNGLDAGPIAGADASLPHVLTPEQLMVEGKPVTGERVLVVDYDGYYVGSCLAERLAREGRRVELLTPEAVASPMCDQTLEGTRVRRRLHELAVGIHRSSLVRRIAPGLVEAASEFGEPLEIAADAVVLVTQRSSDDALLRELAADPDALARHDVEAVYGAGDCVAPRLLADAIFDGHRLGREIDGPHPALALPYLRERPLVTEDAWPAA